jgi:hypothetical protein
MPLQRINIGHMSGLAKIVCGNIAILRFSGVVHSITVPLAPYEPSRVTMSIFYTSE